ncbi:PhzF family phenazine biosynthesis protein, partial [Rhizobium johnstonii]
FEGLAPEADMNARITIEQGVEMGRRRVITLDVVKSNGIVTDVVISGDCVSVMSGEISLQD